MLSHFLIKRLRFVPLVAFIVAAPLYAAFAIGSNTEPESKEASYVVIGAFAYHNNAIRFTAYARSKALNASYAINPNRNLYYVYIFESDDVHNAIREVHKIRSISEFRDAWVYTGVLGEAGKSPEVVATEVIEKVEEDITDDVVVEETVSEVNEPAPSDSVDAAPANLEKEEGFHYLYFNTINVKNYKEVKGRIKVIDPERAKELSSEKSHELVKLRDPKNGTGRVKLSTDIFGFREVQHVIDLDDPVTDTTKAFVDMIGDSIIVNFELQRFKKGDVLVMYNVYFFIDAAIMKPESIYELNSLLDMLRENERLKVRIHGHTNGNSHGKIIYLNKEDKNFFSLDAAHHESTGSAKKLSLQRSYTIQHWLIEQGIKEERMEIKGWGGKKMLYDKHDPQAHKNVRVEIEIVED
ncbi:outer membrane protein, OmpA family [Fulvivirga imtechensis AK7]|uniref:Outer membrane protein, OmpA family n=1 Tax=Fulvivirga imtechensis AK7 TaxID=1237149 RepID=L8JTJ6_9BACT|nr:OmpA family protein [Fulvivirga imtechensis]ELR72140.1 outer membrane protein, OmpA family [Fulvivirga imtechensis AK7]